MKIYCGEKFPLTRLRRNRNSEAMRDLIAQTALCPSNLILPIFVIEGKNCKEKINNLPDVFRLSIDLAVEISREAWSLGIKAIMLFPVVEQKLKTANGEESCNKNNLICRAIREIKNAVPQILIIADVALDPYTSHGHDGLIDEKEYVKNDATVEILCKQALVQAQAGCDIIAPSDMMDGRIKKIRQALDAEGFDNVSLMAYSAKYASNFYGPFREAVGSNNNLKKSDKKNYQMDFHNSDEAMREITLDIKEGADSVIIKPAMCYLDIIKLTSQNFSLPIFAYQVSGEYAMLKFLAQNSGTNFDDLYYESLIAIKRAGAYGIITYGAIDITKYRFQY
jgi:porphobilinogen synthase